jgi:tripartite-type tricarboxylate transporter receptor subunit TctC
MTMLHRASALVLLAAALSPSAFAQSWPDHAITAVVPFAAGAANDIVGRIAYEQVSKQLGQPIVFENKPGAGGVTGANAVAKAAPNGYTILVHSSTFGSSIAIVKTLPYDTLKDFAPVIPLGNSPTVLVVPPSKGFKTVADLIAAAKAKPGAMNFASAGLGSTSHLAAERFRLSAGIEAQHVPFRGPNEAFTELMAGRIDFYFLPLAPALPLVKEGQLTALAVSSEKRALALPDVPTTTELGLKDSTFLFWTGVFLPVKTPRDIVAKLHEETRKALLVPAVQERIARTGNEPMPMSVEEFEKFFTADVIATSKLLEQIGLKPPN